MELTGSARVFRRTFFYLAVLYAVCVAVQVFFAGYATFVNPVKWDWHRTFVHLIEYVPALMLIAGFMGKLPSALRWQSFGLLLLIILMYATANLASGAPIAGAFHPVAALLMFWLSVRIVPKAWKLAYARM